MSKPIILIPINEGISLTCVSLGVIRSMDQQGMEVSFYKPICQSLSDSGQDNLTSRILQSSQQLSIGNPVPMYEAQQLIRHDQVDVLLEGIVEEYKRISERSQVTLIEGIAASRNIPFAASINNEIAVALGADIILVARPCMETVEQLKERIEMASAQFGSLHTRNIKGVIINKVNAPIDQQGQTRPDLSEVFDNNVKQEALLQQVKDRFNDGSLPLLACIPWKVDLIATRTVDIIQHLGAKVVHEGNMYERRIKGITFCVRSIPNMLADFKPGSLLVTSADRTDVLVAACLASVNGLELGGVLLTGGFSIPSNVEALCRPAFEKGLPVFTIEENTWQTSLRLQNLRLDVPTDDQQRIEWISEHIAAHISPSWVTQLASQHEGSTRLSPPAFRYQLTEYARKANKRIVLPEGEEPRTVKAAAICAERGIAHCVLLGSKNEIHRIATSQGVTLGQGIEIIEPKDVRDAYVNRLVDLRKSKGMTEVIAREQLNDTVVLGTMMLEQSEVDGLVSGAVHTTANTIRPPLQIIKTAPDASLVSSVFFMLLPDQVFVYGDCAINPDPNAEQLAEIAIQSADSAASFGIEPKVAMISYSTGSSGQGAEVEKVREATKIAKEKRPDLIIDGPLQYDAAVMENVAASKAPDSPVAGQATVFVFPDLNTGNTTYKAVQRSADLISIGPMLQGMRKPVNDLSRGALVDDIVYTIALTAIQANAQQ